jgi:ribose 1,5-bisphosphokinase
MMVASSRFDHEPPAKGPGRLILVTGPSGAGKDTLIAFARAACVRDRGIVFPRRIVTREASSSEDNGTVTPAQFAEAVARGDFALHWSAHGLHYGLPCEILDEIHDGHVVVANVSRTIVTAARAAFSNVVVVLVTAPPEVLAARLVARARISDGPVEDRLRRTVADGEPDIIINNTGKATDHADELLRVIRGSR